MAMGVLICTSVLLDFNIACTYAIILCPSSIFLPPIAIVMIISHKTPHATACWAVGHLNRLVILLLGPEEPRSTYSRPPTRAPYVYLSGMAEQNIHRSCMDNLISRRHGSEHLDSARSSMLAHSTAGIGNWKNVRVCSPFTINARAI